MSTPMERRLSAAEKFRPEAVDTLIVAEAPPQDEERYFYFEGVEEHDSLFRYIAREVLGVIPSRQNKGELLGSLRERGIFLIDLKLTPVDGTPLSESVPDLVRRVRELSPRKVILVKVTVFDAAFRALEEAGLPVADERIPFPGSGQQRRFQEAFRRALAV